jgi:hypothetical protein
MSSSDPHNEIGPASEEDGADRTARWGLDGLGGFAPFPG